VFRQIRSKLLAAFAVPLAVLVAVAGLAISSTLSQTGTAQDEKEAVALAAVGLAAALLGLVLVIRVSRAVSRPLADLANQAEHLANVSLPAAVQAILDADATGGQLPEVPKVRVGDIEEVAGVAIALEALNKTAVELASGQAALRRNLSDAFVNLGRRNQNLVTRQLEYITEIELKEADPTSLEELFRLDHLATRMRRNAESLLILAGSGPARHWNASVPVMDVARAASAEVEDYKRLRLHHFDPAMVTGIVTTDLVHILAELIENALSFSPPGAPVDVYGRFLEGGYVIVIVDSGIGMSSDDLATANQRLEGQGADGEVPGRYLGHFVAGRLAARHAVAISLQPSHSGGLVARVKVPASLMEEPVADLSASAEVRSDSAEVGSAPTISTAAATPLDERGPDVAPSSAPPVDDKTLELAASLAAATFCAEGPAPVPVEPATSQATVFGPDGHNDENTSAYGDEPVYDHGSLSDDAHEVSPVSHDADELATVAGNGVTELGAVWSAKFSGPAHDQARPEDRANYSEREVGTEATDFVTPYDWSRPAVMEVALSAAEISADAEPPVPGWDPLPIAPVASIPPVAPHGDLGEPTGEASVIVAASSWPAPPDLSASGPLAAPPRSSGPALVGPAAQARSTADALRKLTRRVPGAALPEEDDSLRRPTSMSTTRNPLGLSGALSQYLAVTVEGRPEKEHNPR
jgi:signal transduction histidine kinase